jgi:hypothetical protein
MPVSYAGDSVVRLPPPLPTHIKVAHLYRAKPRDVLRLAHFLGLATLGKTLEQIIQETHI